MSEHTSPYDDGIIHPASESFTMFQGGRIYSLFDIMSGGFRAICKNCGKWQTCTAADQKSAEDKLQAYGWNFESGDKCPACNSERLRGWG